MLHGKRVLVIDGGSGAGLATARLAAESGAEVSVAGPAARLQSAPPDAGWRIVRLDPAQDADLAALFREAPRLDHLVVDAAAPPLPGPFLDTPVETARRVFEDGFWIPYAAARRAARVLAPDGSITLFSGAAALQSAAGLAAAVAANGAVEALSRALAVELAPIRVNAVRPGAVDAPRPARRSDASEELARAALFCMENGFLTGGVLVVDGGYRLI